MPQEIKFLKHLLNIEDPEERFSALATAFSPGSEHEVKDPDAFYTLVNLNSFNQSFQLGTKFITKSFSSNQG